MIDFWAFTTNKSSSAAHAYRNGQAICGSPLEASPHSPRWPTPGCIGCKKCLAAKARLSEIGKRLKVGDVVATSYGTGPYRITAITRDCRCVTAQDEYDGITELPPHIHLTCREVTARPHTQKGHYFYLGFYDETTLQSVRSDDRLQQILPSYPPPPPRPTVRPWLP